MDELGAMKHLQALKLLFEKFESIETCDKDIEALEVAIEALKKIMNRNAGD